MKLLLLLTCHLYLRYTFATNDAQCGITGISDEIWQGQLQLDIKDTQIDTDIFTSKYTGSIDNITCKNMKDFFAVKKNGTDFVIKTTPMMESFDEKTMKTTRKFSTESFKCNITCNKSPQASTLSVFLKITDINTHPPHFFENEYIFHVPSPVMPLTDFSIYGNRIVATDLDFSNQHVTFTIDPDHFDVDTQTTSENKNYTALFSSKRPIEIIEDKVYTLTAKDSGDNPHPLSSSVKVTLKSNVSSSIDTPSFKETSYEFNYSNDDGPKLTPKGDKITVKTNKPNYLSNKSFELKGDLSHYLTPSYDSSSQTITFDIKEISATSDFLLSTLTAKTDQTGSTTIVVYMPVKNNKISFNSHLYQANYNKNNKTITVDTVIKITSPEGLPNVTIYGDHSDYFQIKYNRNTKSYDFSLAKDHTIEQLGNSTVSKQVLRAKLGNDVDKAQLILTLPTHVLKFSKPLYIASYNSSTNNIYFDNDNIIKFTTEVDKVDVSVDETYTKYFTIKYDSGERRCDLEVSGQLPENILETGKDIIVTLTAEDKYINKDQTNVRIAIPSEDKLEFSDAYYQVDYPASGSGNIDLPVAFENVKDPSKVSISLKSYTGNFEVNFTSNKWQIHIKEALNASIIKKYPELPIAMSASNDVNKKGSLSTLLLKLPVAATANLKFSNAYYTGIYPTNNTGEFETDHRLSFVGDTNNNHIKIVIENYERNFNVTFAADKWIINVISPLDEKVLEKDLLITNLIATSTESSEKARAVLIIQFRTKKLPEAPTFSKLYYQGKLHFRNHQSIVAITDDLVITNKKDMTKINVTIDTAYEKYFKVSYTSKTKKWTVSATQNLPKEQLEANVIVITLTASEAGVKNKGETVLVLSIDRENPPIIFKDKNYDTIYPSKGEGEMSINPNVSLENVDDVNKVKMSVHEFENNFQVLYDSSKKWYINIKKPLDEGIMSSYTDIITSLNATEEGRDDWGSAILFVKLPIVEAPIFSRVLYFGKYTNETGKVNVTSDEIKITNKDDLDKITLSLDSTYKKYFNFMYDRLKKCWVLRSLIPLPDYLFSKPELVLTITAAEKNNTHTGSSGLFLKLPSGVDSPPKFSKPYYSGKYMIEDKRPNINVDVISIANKDPSSIDLSVDSQYEKFFKCTYKASKKSWTIEPLALLSENLLAQKELLLAITATENGNENKALAIVVLSLPSNADTKFSSTYYEAAYDLSHGKPDIIMTDKILIVSTEQIKVYLKSDTIDVGTYLIIEKEESDEYVLHVIKPLPEEILKLPSLVLTIVAEMSYAKSNATLVINMPTRVRDRAIEFKQVLYAGEVDDGVLSVDNIEIVTKEEDANVWTRIEESKYSKYFQASYINKKLTVSFKKSVPDEELRTIPSTLLTVAVGISKTRDETSAVLSLKSSIDNTPENTAGSNKGGYIATISTLAVALVVVIVGAASFYIFKIRNRLISNFDKEDAGHIKFNKKSMRKTSEQRERKSSEISQRRPTGFVFNSLSEETADEIEDTDGTESKERRKSVAFDENVQKLQIESTHEEEEKSDVEDSDKDSSKQIEEVKTDIKKALV